MPTLSIITPFWNTPQALFAPCARAILEGGYTDFEWLIVDDGSAPRAKTVLKDLAASDARVRLIETAHVGVSAARNAGLEQATGTYATFVDSDDIVGSGFFAQAIARLEETHADIALGIIERRYPDGRTVRPGQLEPFTATSPAQAAAFLRVAIAGENLAGGPDLKSYGMYTVAPRMYRRSAIATLRFDERMALGEDSLFNAEAAARARRILAVPSVWYTYVINNGSSFQGVTPQPAMLELLRSFDAYADKARIHGWDDSDVALRYLHSMLTFSLTVAEVCPKDLLGFSRAAMALSPAGLFPAIRIRDYRMSFWMRLVALTARARRPLPYSLLVGIRAALRHAPRRARK